MSEVRSELSFVRTLSLAEFAQETGASSLEILYNGNTKKHFFGTNIRGLNGKVSDKIVEEGAVTLDHVVSEVIDPETPETPFWMLHIRAEKANVVASINLLDMKSTEATKAKVEAQV